MTAEALAIAQLAAYNAHDLGRFVDCYTEDVRVLDASGAETLAGRAAFSARYAALFADFDEVGAAVDQRLVAEPHVVDDERWWRRRRADGALQSGRVLVRYTARDGRIATVQFFPAGA